MIENNDFNNTENDSTNSRNKKRFTLVFDHEHDGIGRIEKDNIPIHNSEVVEMLNKLSDENEQLKQSIKEIDDAELHLKQIILKRIDDYIWEWEDEGTPVAQVLRELRDEIKGDVE